MCYYGISRYASQAFPHEWHAYMAGNMKANPSLCNCELCACESYKDHVLVSCSSIGGKQAFSITSSVHRSPFQPSSTSLATFTSAPKETWPTVSASSHVSDHGLGFSWSSKPNRPVSKKSLLHAAAGRCIERTWRPASRQKLEETLASRFFCVVTRLFAWVWLSWASPQRAITLNHNENTVRCIDKLPIERADHHQFNWGHNRLHMAVHHR